MQMDFYGLDDGAFHHTLNLASASWVLYFPTEDLVNSGVVCIGPATNNITEYEAVIGLLIEATSQDVRDLVVFLRWYLLYMYIDWISVCF